MNKWMQIAYDEASLGMLTNEGGPFGAVIVREGKIISRTHNKVLKTNDPTAHAEINAIREASKILNTFNLSDCTLYTTCEPCPMCLGAIFWARIPKVYYGATKEDAAIGGFDDKHFYQMLNNKSDEITLHQIDHIETKELFQVWNNKTDATPY